MSEQQRERSTEMDEERRKAIEEYSEQIWQLTAKAASKCRDLDELAVLMRGVGEALCVVLVRDDDSTEQQRAERVQNLADYVLQRATGLSWRLKRIRRSRSDDDVIDTHDDGE